MATRVSQSKQSTKHDNSPLAADEWQLRILSELHEKQPRPTVKQRRQLAAQTGLDIKWITKWFKRVNSASKSKLQSTVGCPLSKSPTAAAATATKSIDGSSLNPVETADPTESGISPSLLSTEKHALLFSGSGVVPESGRSAAAGPNHGSPQLRSWELGLEHLAVAPDAKANRGPHNPIFHPRSQGENPAAVVPRPHLDLAQQTPLGIVTGPLYLASPFKDGTTSSALTQSGVNVTAQSVKSRGPHTSPSPDPLHTRYLHLNLVSKALAPAYTTEYGHPQAQRGLVGHAVAEESAAAAAVRTNVIDLSVPDLVTAQFGPSSAPLPSMYGLLFDTDRDSVDGLRADERSRSSSRLLLGSDRMMMSPHVTVTVPVNPTPVSFLAKWEDMLALERQIRSSSCGAKLVQAKKAQAVEAHRTRLQGSRGEVTLTGTGTDRLPCGLDEQHFSPLSEIFEEPHKEDIHVSYSHSGVE